MLINVCYSKTKAEDSVSKIVSKCFSLNLLIYSHNLIFLIISDFQLGRVLLLTNIIVCVAYDNPVIEQVIKYIV